MVYRACISQKMGANQFGTVLTAWHPVIPSIFTWKVFTEKNTLILSILLEKRGIPKFPFQFEPIQTSKTERSLAKAKPEVLDARDYHGFLEPLSSITHQ